MDECDECDYEAIVFCGHDKWCTLHALLWFYDHHTDPAVKAAINIDLEKERVKRDEASHSDP